MSREQGQQRIVCQVNYAVIYFLCSEKLIPFFPLIWLTAIFFCVLIWSFTNTVLALDDAFFETWAHDHVQWKAVISADWSTAFCFGNVSDLKI